MASIQSTLDMPPRFSHSLCLGVSLPFCLPASSIMPCRHRIRCRPCHPFSRDHMPPSSVYHVVSLRLLTRFALSLRLSYRFVSFRLSPRLRDVLSLLALGVRLADALASFLRSVATVPPPPHLACTVGCLSCRVCAILRTVVIGTFRLVAFVPRPHKPHC